MNNFNSFKYKKCILFFIIGYFISLYNLSYAQSNSKVIPCYTSEMHEIMMKANPKLAKLSYESEKRFDKFAAEFARKQILNNSLNKTSTLEGSKYIIPTVVHVIHSGWGTSDSISEEQVKSMFLPLFNDLRKVPGTRGFGGGTDTKIEFQLATKDPSGKTTNGIVYVMDSIKNRVRIDSDSAGIKPGFGNISLKNLSRWDTTRYCNIWIVNSIGTLNGQLGGIAGYAQYPWYPSPATDGVVVGHNFFGTLGSSKHYSSTTTHEIGHWVGLIHPFDSAGVDGCTPGNCLTWGDKVCDLNPTAPGFRTITKRENSCDNDYPDWANNSRNYMDYSDDEWKPNHYSPGQAVRSVASLENPEFYRKNKLWSQENNERCGVGSWGPPHANFWADNLRPCINSPVTFIDYSCNKPTEYRWKFIGATPETSTEQFPVVRYNRAGKFPVELWVKNYSGIKDSLIKLDFIEVIDTLYKPPFYEGFEGPIFPPKYWRIENPDTGKIEISELNKPKNDKTWEKVTKFGGFDSTKSSVRMPMFTYDDYWQRDGLVSPPLDLSGMKNVALKFSLSYRPIRWGKISFTDNSKDRDYTDTLEVYVTDDCGASWNRVLYAGGKDISTMNNNVLTIKNVNLDTTGDARTWKAHALNLDKWAGKSNIMFKFETINGWGNNLYLDDIKIVDEKVTNTLNRDKNIVSGAHIYPNPFHDSFNIKLEDSFLGEVNIQILDIQGRIVHTQNYSSLQSDKLLSISTNELSEGIYVISLNHAGNVHYYRIIKE